MIGIFLGFLVGAVVALIFLFIRSEFDAGIPCDKEWIANIITAILSIAVVIVCMFGGVSIERNSNSKTMAQFTATKHLIESSITNDTLTGFERVELVRQATEANSTLIGLQYDCQQWYGFTIDDVVLDLEPISFDTKGDTP